VPDGSGNIEGSRAASINLPAPGEPIIEMRWPINPGSKGHHIIRSIGRMASAEISAALNEMVQRIPYAEAS
jgi:hypothetical protein